MEHSDALESYVRTRALKLDRFSDRVTGCHVSIEAPHQHAHSGRHYRIRIDLIVPGAEIVVTRAPDENAENEDAYAAIGHAFDVACRRLQDHVRRARGDVKPHEYPKEGRIAKLFGYEGYGFIDTVDGDEVYFHRNAVLDGAFNRMAIGAKVTFVEELGERGPQASTVTLTG